MNIRRYYQAQDFDRVSQFLIETYQPGETMFNWLQRLAQQGHQREEKARPDGK